MPCPQASEDSAYGITTIALLWAHWLPHNPRLYTPWWAPTLCSALIFFCCLFHRLFMCANHQPTLPMQVVSHLWTLDATLCEAASYWWLLQTTQCLRSAHDAFFKSEECVQTPCVTSALESLGIYLVSLPNLSQLEVSRLSSFPRP